ncbi:TPA: mandelate racemase [Candidatus Poribacteria bacterium]|nr:mandelate racemase [Candidatus Poribacteria bacterium]
MNPKALEEHRISDIKTLKVTSRYPRMISKNARVGVHGTGSTAQVRVITTNQGSVGWGLSWADEQDMFASLSSSPSVNRPDLIGKSVAELFNPEVGVIHEEFMPLDFPLHDLAGVILNQPVYQMLGSNGTTVVPCYDGAIYMDDLLPEDNPRGIEAVLTNCRNDYDLGYRAFKLKIGRGYKWMETEEGLRRDIEVTRKVRENFPDCQILVDANNGYTCDGFIRYFDAVADCSIFWVEEPFHENREDLSRLKEFLAKRSPNTLIADGESGYDIESLLKLANEGLVDVLIMDIAGLGFTNWRKLMPRVIEAKVQISPHTWGNPLKTLYASQLAAGLGNTVTLEGIPTQTSDVDWSPYELKDGLLHVPAEPGFGISIKHSIQT